MFTLQTKTLLLISSLIGIAIAFSVLFSLDALQNNNLQALLDRFVPRGPIGFITLLAVLSALTSIGLPRQVAAFSCGYIFGTLYGTLLATIAATLGCIITLFIAKTFFRQKVLNAYPDKLNSISLFFSTHTFSKAFIIRILPAGSNFLTNVLAGIAKVNMTSYVTGTCLGFIPQMAIFSLLGAGVKVGERQQILLSVFLLFAALLLGYWLYKKEKWANKKGAI